MQRVSFLETSGYRKQRTQMIHEVTEDTDVNRHPIDQDVAKYKRLKRSTQDKLVTGVLQE